MNFLNVHLSVDNDDTIYIHSHYFRVLAGRGKHHAHCWAIDSSHFAPSNSSLLLELRSIPNERNKIKRQNQKCKGIGGKRTIKDVYHFELPVTEILY
jgi:hypothetical protein